MTYLVVLAVLILPCLMVPAEGQRLGDKCSTEMQMIANPASCDSCMICTRKFIWAERRCPASLECSPSHQKCVSRKISTCQKTCDKLPVDPSGSWSPASCTSGPSNLGATCSKSCNSNFELRGSSVIKCTEFGWNSTNGNFIPKCVDVQCYSQIMKDTLNTTLSTCAGMLFVMDESGSIGAGDFIKSKDFVKDIAKAFPLSSSRTAGVITFDSIPRDRIPLTEANTYNFQVQVGNINYNSGGTDVLEALERALIVMNSYSRSVCYVVILITDGNSETEATPAADAIKKANHPLFSIAVGSPNSLSYVESLSSKGKNGVRHFFYSRTFDILKEIGKYFNSPSPPPSRCGP